MSEFMESTGKTVDEAIREALLRMGLRREEVEVTVIQRDRGGLLGIGRRQAVVRVERKQGAKRGSGSNGGRGRRGGAEVRGERLDDGQERGSRRRRSGGGRRGRDDEQRETRGRDQGGRGRGRDRDRDGDQQSRDGGRGGRGRGGRRRQDGEPAEAREEQQPRNAAQERGDDRQQRQDSDQGGEGRSRRRRRRPRRRKPAAEVEAAVANPVGDGKVFSDDAPEAAAQEPRHEETRREETRHEEPRREEPRHEEPQASAPVEEPEAAREPVADDRPEAVASGAAILLDQVAAARVKPFAEADTEPFDGFLEKVASGLMVKSGFPSRVQVKEGEYHQVKMVVDDRSAGVLIGRHGATVDAVEYLVEKMASHAVGDRVRMNLDINNYRLRRHDSLEQRARNAAAEARNTGEPVAMDPMHARERRIVHLEIEDMDDLVTYTEDGMDGKFVVICREDQIPSANQPSVPAAERNEVPLEAAPEPAPEPEPAEDTVDTSGFEPMDEEPEAVAATEAMETAAVITDDADDLDDEEPRRTED